jgi:hypothetical protein
MATTKATLDIPAPRPWRIEGQAIWDADGVCIVSALNPASMATRRLIVEAVNGRGRLRDLVRRLAEYIRLGHCNEVHIDRADTRQSYHVRAADLLREAEAALAKEVQP